MLIIGLGHLLFALSVAGLGVLGLLSGDFALNWQPVPAWVPFREVLAYASGALLLIGGLGMIVRRIATLSALIMTVNFLAWLLLLRLPPVISAPLNEGVWLGFGETSVLVAGAWVIFASLAGREHWTGAKLFVGDDGARLARLLFAVALPLIGLSHFVYLKATMSFVPAYLPDHMGFAYLTGAGHIAAGLALLFGVLPRLAATLEAAMMGVFTVLVWLPGALATPTNRFQWTALLVSTALSAAGWAVADSLHARSWWSLYREPAEQASA
ncbi:MAG: DoxX family membrane protein [Alphaproteobacteria bacterium]|nr:DoxX family membrane protein [Alphaproteobacteria bacterium]